MGSAYTPGLKVTENERLKKHRSLPLKGDVKVEAGQKVSHDHVVAQTFLPGKVQMVNIANKLGIDQADVPAAMIRKQGDTVEKSEVIAKSSSFFGLFKAEAKATMRGTIEAISGVTGQVVLRGDPEPVEVIAYVDGTVIEVMEGQGCVVETVGSFVQGIFGIGGETSGELVIVCDSPEQVLTPDRLKASHQGKLVVGGSLVTADALKRAIELEVAGVIVGGFDDKDLRDFLGYDLGVAITGHENLGITLVVTEGFGKINMAPRTYALLKEHAGDHASMNGATQIRAGVIRPEVIIPMAGTEHIEDHAGDLGVLQPGSPVRVIRSPYFGVLGKVVSLPSEPIALESGSKARVAEIALDGGTTAMIPRANLERIEE